MSHIEQDSGDAVPSSMVAECILVHSGKVVVRLILPSNAIVHNLQCSIGRVSANSANFAVPTLKTCNVVIAKWLTIYMC